MKRNTQMDKELLAAFVDGELSPEEAARVVMHLADTPADQAYVDDLVAANEALAIAFGGVLSDPVPDAIRAAILGQGVAPKAEPLANVVAFRRPVARSVWQAGLALAAGLGVVAVLATGMINPTGPQRLAAGPLPADSDIARAFQTLPTGSEAVQTDGATLTLMASFALDAGMVCREFEMTDAAMTELNIGLACKDAGSDWQVRVLASENLNDTGSDTFVTASGREVGLLDAFLNKNGAGQALSPVEEADRIAGGWVN